MPLLEVAGLRKTYGAGVESAAVFSDVDLRVEAGEFLAVIGESGVGKSTLLNCIAGLDSVDAGTVHLDGTEVTGLAEPAQALLRRAHLGFVFQAFHVLPHLSVRRNVGLPLMLLGQAPADIDARVDEMLEAVGLASLAARMPRQLSGGQLQRVAIARALVHRPRLILADEPTGNLDPTSAQHVIELLAAQVREAGAACVLVTHSRAAAARASRTVVLTAAGVRPLG